MSSSYLDWIREEKENPLVNIYLHPFRAKKKRERESSKITQSFHFMTVHMLIK